MGISFEVAHGVGFFFLLTCVSIQNILKSGGKFSRQRESLRKPNSRIVDITIIFNLIISFTYVGLYGYEILNTKTILSKSAFPTIAWLLVASYTLIKHDKHWPRPLLFWWLFTFILNSTSVSNSILAHLKKSENFPGVLTSLESVQYFIILPFSLFVCVNAFWFAFTDKHTTDIQIPLLHFVEETEYCDFVASGIWSHLTFQWLNPLFKTGRYQKLKSTQIPKIPPSEFASQASLSLEESLRNQKSGNSSLLKAISHSVWRPLSVNAIFAAINTIASYAGPLLIKDFVNFITGTHDHSIHTSYGIILALVFFVLKTVESLSQRQWLFSAERIGVRTRAGLIVLIYKKSISLKEGSMLRSGKITNLINVDVERIGELFSLIHQVWLLPLQVTLALIILYKNLGAVPSAAALFSTVFVMVSNTPLASIQERLHSKIMEAKDLRIKTTSETLRYMRVLKLYSWDSAFLEKILHLRETETNWLRKYLYMCSTVAFLFWASPTLISVITFGVCIVLKTPLTASTVLSVLATLRILQEPLNNLPELISMIAQAKVSLDRIQGFIREEDRTKLLTSNASASPDIAVEIQTGEYAWQTSDINSRIPTVKFPHKIKILKGQKVAICGSVGSGKSSLLCSMLGEMPRISGSQPKVYGTKAYVPQTAWIQSGSIRDNVLFGKEMNECLYEDILERCALDRDIETWDQGDLSVVGERGMNLSGGQKQRIQLARALYSNSDVYFLDDPFSAVDAHTGAHLFKKCLMQLLFQKTVLYVTHQLEFLDFSDIVLVMKDGRIVEYGKYECLMTDPNSELSKQITAHRKSIREVNRDQIGDTVEYRVHQNNNKLTAENFKDPIVCKNPCDRKAQEEETEVGRVKWSVYWTFVTSAYRGSLVPVILLCQLLFQGLQMGSNYWIAWASEKQSMVSKRKLIGIFTLMSGMSSFFILGRAVLLSTIAIETSQCLFLGMIKSIFRAPILFFDTTPSSRILSRASTDQSTVDTDIPYRLAGLAFALIQLFSIIVLMCQVAWHILPVFVVVLAISMWYQAYYIPTARELARMVGTWKAPIVHHFSESISGVSTIRCFNQEERFLAKNLRLIDDYSRMVFHNTATMQWLCVRINFLFNLVFFIDLVILVSLPKSAINPSLAGLAATYGLNMNVLQGWVIWNLCNVENKMISVERILQFCHLPSEAPLRIEDSKCETKWPTVGKIELENLQVQYSRSLPIILKGITCTFPGEKKIGVVGRTGSGKSTLIQALFRMVEPTRGRILIDGVDISKMGLQDLRSRLNIIPQDPTLFQGTMRMNVDPLQQHSDHEIWEVLNKCRLANIVRQDQRLLDAPVAEDGENWSVGQRQLVCLARVLLQRKKILVLDEATASVDTETDHLIQMTIREETRNSTVITVAHRIPTVLDNDLVLVLDEGNILEFNSPDELLKDMTSAFSKLVTEFLRSSKSCHQEIEHKIY